MKHEEIKNAGTVRFTVTVEKDAFEALDRYCEVLGVTKSHVVNSWLVSATDSLMSLLDVIERAKTGEISLVDLEAKLSRYEGILSAVEREDGL